MRLTRVIFTITSTYICIYLAALLGAIDNCRPLITPDYTVGVDAEV